MAKQQRTLLNMWNKLPDNSTTPSDACDHGTESTDSEAEGIIDDYTQSGEEPPAAKKRRFQPVWKIGRTELVGTWTIVKQMV